MKGYNFIYLLSRKLIKNVMIISLKITFFSRWSRHRLYLSTCYEFFISSSTCMIIHSNLVNKIYRFNQFSFAEDFNLDEIWMWIKFCRLWIVWAWTRWYNTDLQPQFTLKSYLSPARRFLTVYLMYRAPD